MALSLTRTTEPVTDPITLSEMKIYLRVDGSDDDDLIESLVTAATKDAEDYCHRAFITQEWKMVTTKFDSKIELPLPTLQSVESVTGRDCDGVETEASTDTYWVDIDSEPGKVQLKNGQSWPDLSEELIIEFTCGYGDEAADVPMAIRTAIKRIVATWYENREDLSIKDSVNEIPTDAKQLLNPYRIIYL